MLFVIGNCCKIIGDLLTLMILKKLFRSLAEIFIIIAKIFEISSNFSCFRTIVHSVEVNLVDEL